MRLIQAILFTLFAVYSLTAQTISVQGVLREPSGRTVDDGNYNVTFKIYNVKTGGTALWSDIYAALPVKFGVFQANLGEGTPLGSLPFDQVYYVGVTVEGFDEMEPRIQLGVYPYARAILGQDNKFPSTGDVEMMIDNFVIHEGNLEIRGTGGAIVFNDGTSLNSANFGGPAGSLANPSDVIINAGTSSAGGSIDFQVAGTSLAIISEEGAFFDILSASELSASNEISANSVSSNQAFFTNSTINSEHLVGLESGLHTIMNNNQIRAKNGTADSKLYLNYSGGNVQVGNDVNHMLSVGSEAGYHLSMKGSELWAQNGAATSTLYLNRSNGGVQVGNSNSHIFRVGSSSSKNVIVTGEKVQALNNGAASTLLLNPEGGLVNAQTTFHVSTADGKGLQFLTSGGIQGIEAGGAGLVKIQPNGGNVQIGGDGSNANNAKLFINGSAGDFFSSYSSYLDAFNVVAGNAGDYTGKYGIITTDRILSEAYMVWSDERLKNIIDRSDNKEDLAALKNIKITNYNFKDRFQYGNKRYKKVIAQELKEVLPEAISYQTSYIPSVYSPATAVAFNAEKQSLSVTTQHAHDFKVGDKIKLILTEEVLLTEVEAVHDATTFAVAHDQLEENVFVYGKMVDDLHVVDYEAISMLNVSATQELAKRSEEQAEKIAELEAENAWLKKNLEALNAFKAEVSELLQLSQKKAANSLVGQN